MNIWQRKRDQKMGRINKKTLYLETRAPFISAAQTTSQTLLILYRFTRALSHGLLIHLHGSCHWASGKMIKNNQNKIENTYQPLGIFRNFSTLK